MRMVPFVSRVLTVAAALAAGMSVAAAATPAGWVATRTLAHAPALLVATDAGAMAEAEVVPIAVALPVRDAAGLAALAGTRGAKPLTTAQFLDRYAPTADAANRVVAHLRANGFQNIVVADNRLLVTADGTPARIRSAFQAELHSFDVNGRRAYANVTDALVPASLADAVLAVVGLQTVQMAHTNTRRVDRTTASPLATPLAVTGVSPPLFPSIYGAAGMPSATAATIGIITQGSMTQTVTDLNAFAASAGYPTPPVSVVTVGRASTDTSGIDEWNLDTQSSLAAAGGTVASIKLYTATTLSDSNLLAAYNKAVSDNLARVINVSLGECENSAKTSGAMAAADQVFQAAASQGQTFSVASGDSGSYECGGSTNSQSYPAVSPYVMAIGGTTLSTSGGTWLGETAWSCTGASTCPQSASGGTGGGVSLTESAPNWQTNAGVLTTPGKRGVPDISFDASPSSGARVIVNGSLYQIGGTSLSAPLFTGFYSRVQSAHGNTLGFAAPTIYAGAASNPSWFHDVTSGSNGGYSAGAGWDYVTGWGSLQVQNFSSSLPNGGGAAPTAWTTIAVENQVFTVDGTQTVRYGAGTSWVTMPVSGSGACSNTFFGNDPLVGTVKSCQVVSTAGGTVWTQVATENQAFSVSGAETVRYGAGSTWITMTVNGGGTCSNAFYGTDPLVGTVKSCQIVTSTAAATSWTKIATEGQSFSVSGTQTVRYGSGTTFILRNMSSGGTCSNDFFGIDPLQGTVKECDAGS